MTPRASLVLLLGVVLCGTGCGTPGGVTDDPGQLTFSLGQFEVPPGDSFECFYTSVMTPRELSVNAASGRQGPGGHHLTVYYFTGDRPQAPGHHPCTDDEMLQWQQIAGASGDGSGAEGAVSLPEGLAAKIPAGKQIVIQAHYINVSGKTMTVDDEVSLHLLEPEKVRAYANYFLINDATFEVPAGRRVERVSTCTVPQDLQIVLMLGHMHEQGTYFKLERLDGSGQPAEVLIDHPWQPLYTSHPPVFRYPVDKPYLFQKGTKLRQTCRWDNSTASISRFPREMCISFMYFFPGTDDVYCRDIQPVL